MENIKEMSLTKKGMLLLALLENNLLKEDEFTDEFWDKYNKTWDIFEQMIYENNLMENSELNILG